MVSGSSFEYVDRESDCIPPITIPTNAAMMINMVCSFTPKRLSQNQAAIQINIQVMIEMDNA